MVCNGLRRSHGQTLINVAWLAMGPAQLCVTLNHASEMCQRRRRGRRAVRASTDDWARSLHDS